MNLSKEINDDVLHYSEKIEWVSLAEVPTSEKLVNVTFINIQPNVDV